MTTVDTTNPNRPHQTKTPTMTTTTTVTIKLLKEVRTVPAVRVEGGLALHRDVDRPAYWSISHVPSGCLVWSKCARGKADAMVRFDALLALTNWDRPEQDLVSEDGLFYAIRALETNPPSAPRQTRDPRPPRRVATRTTRDGRTFEAPVWWEEGGLTVEGDPKEGFRVTHEASGLRVVMLPRKVSRAKAIRLAKTLLGFEKTHGMDWGQKNPFPPSGAPQELRDLVRGAVKGIF